LLTNATERDEVTDTQEVSLLEAAQQLKVHPNTVRNWVREGNVPFTTRGGHGAIYVRLADLEGRGKK
jgi:excisionase family DNA binding protein